MNDWRYLTSTILVSASEPEESFPRLITRKLAQFELSIIREGLCWVMPDQVEGLWTDERGRLKCRTAFAEYRLGGRKWRKIK